MGKDPRTELTANAASISEIVQTTLGPFGANKLVIDDGGKVSTTTVGSVLLDRIDIDEPSVTLLRAAAADFEDEYGDGTSTVVTIAGGLLNAYTEFADKGLHPTTVERGYREALSISKAAIDRSTRPLSEYGVTPVAKTALTGTRDPHARETVSNYLERICETHESSAFNFEQLKVATRLGGGQAETELVEGLILEKEPVAEDMPRSFSDVGVGLLSATIDVPRLGGEGGTLDADIVINDAKFEDRVALADRERELFQDQLQRIHDAGCRVLVTSVAINDRVKRDIANAGILGLQRVDESDLRRLAQMTGGEIADALDHINGEMLGRADVGIRREAGRDMAVFESTIGDPTYTLFCRAPDPRATDAFRRSVESAISAVDQALSTSRVVPGGGASEMRASHAVREQARSISGSEQLAVEAFGNVLRVVPRALAANAGMDGWEAVLRLHVAHSEGRHEMGIDCLTGEIVNVVDGPDPIVEPAILKRAILESATDLAVKLIRIDERLSATELESEPDYADDRMTPEQE